MGSPGFFGDIAVKKFTVSGLCDSYTVDLEASSYYMQNPPFLFHTVTEGSGLESSFEAVRDDPRFMKAVEEAKLLTNEWLKKHRNGYLPLISDKHKKCGDCRVAAFF